MFHRRSFIGRFLLVDPCCPRLADGIFGPHDTEHGKDQDQGGQREAARDGVPQAAFTNKVDHCLGVCVGGGGGRGFYSDLYIYKRGVGGW